MGNCSSASKNTKVPTGKIPGADSLEKKGNDSLKDASKSIDKNIDGVSGVTKNIDGIKPPKSNDYTPKVDTNFPSSGL